MPWGEICADLGDPKAALASPDIEPDANLPYQRFLPDDDRWRLLIDVTIDLTVEEVRRELAHAASGRPPARSAATLSVVGRLSLELVSVLGRETNYPFDLLYVQTIARTERRGTLWVTLRRLA